METKELKAITLGDSGVGKTSILNIIKGRDNNISNNDKNGNFVIKRKYEKKNMMISLNLMDSNCNQNNEKSIPIQYIRDSHIVLLIFCNIETLNSLKDRWYTFYKENSNIENSRFILIANKSDTFGENRDEIIKQGNKFAEEIDAHLITCSAKSEDNMDNLDRYITTEAKRFIDESENVIRIQETSSFKIRNEQSNFSSNPCSYC